MEEDELILHTSAQSSSHHTDHSPHPTPSADTVTQEPPSNQLPPMSTDPQEPSSNDDRQHGHNGTLSARNANSEDGGGNETWIDFLRRTGNPDEATTEAVMSAQQTSSAIGDVRNRPLPVPGSAFPMTSTPDTRPDLERKRRSTGSGSQSRRTSNRWSYTPGSELERAARTVHAPPNSGAAAYGSRPPAPPELPTFASLPLEQSVRAGVAGEQDFGHGDIVLPQWQPDSEVVACPVCRTQFSFFFRKHHCRKCGRVVCANCSPHRITIPKQFIVQPPVPATPTFTTSFTSVPNSTGQDDDMDLVVSGGEEVRVCNPCVPDPNLSPPSYPSIFNTEQDGHSHSTMTSSYYPRPPQYSDPRYHTHHRSNISLPRPQFAHPGTQVFHYNSSHRRGSNSTNQLPRLPAFPFSNMYRNDHSERSDPDALPHFPIPNQARPYFGTYHQTRNHRSESTPTDPFRLPPLNRLPPIDINLNTNAPYSPLPPIPNLYSRHRRSPPAATPQPPPPRRRIAEEDECPVCGNELPLRSEGASEAAREAHVQECIGAHFAGPSSAPGGNTQPLAANDDNRTSVSDARHDYAAAQRSRNNQTEPQSYQSGTVLRPRRVTGTRMLTYRATEKDCIGLPGSSMSSDAPGRDQDAAGAVGAAECVICFEEYEVGDEMARLECLCRFHKICIRGWWDVKGYGSCPTHQVQDLD